MKNNDRKKPAARKARGEGRAQGASKAQGEGRVRTAKMQAARIRKAAAARRTPKAANIHRTPEAQPDAPEMPARPMRKAGRTPWRRKHSVPAERVVVVPPALVSAVQKAYVDWLWQAYRGRKRGLEYLGGQIGLSRPALTKVLQRRNSVRLATFVKACFLQPGTCVLVAEAGGWRLVIQWSLNKAT